MNGLPTPTIDALVESHRSQAMGSAARNWARYWSQVEGQPDLDRIEPRVAIHDWLNRFGCRLKKSAIPERADTVVSLGAWWRATKKELVPLTHTDLADLTDDQLECAIDCYLNLKRQPASDRRSLGPTAAAKVLMGVAPQTFPAWDAKIARTHYQGTGGPAYRLHLEACRSWAQSLGPIAAQRDLVESATGITMAKLLDEWLYQVTTRGLKVT